MKRRTLSSAVMCCALGLSGLWVSSSAGAQTTAAIDPAAVQKLERMTRFLDELPKFSVKTSSTIEDLSLIHI